mmetsp:Transcript_19714/g.49065  ORF Transcript_19714/g.49065 Transcript_19714/m.49065 type:complete len:97 (-) Transcript_19714:182-472(-)
MAESHVDSESSESNSEGSLSFSKSESDVSHNMSNSRCNSASRRTNLAHCVIGAFFDFFTMMMRVAAGHAKLWLRRTNVRSSTRKKCGRLAKMIDSL